ncbi:hypothetical protein BHE74_00011005 [Ensete ventricosum]|nr:hypothetical protein BHE74_00011005 [Ensete ventricosum]
MRRCLTAGSTIGNPRLVDQSKSKSNGEESLALLRLLAAASPSNPIRPISVRRHNTRRGNEKIHRLTVENSCTVAERCGSCPCALVRPWSSRDGVGAWLDGWIPRTPSQGLAAGVAELGSGGGTSGHPYLVTLLPLWLIMSSYPSTTPTVLVVRHAYAGKGVDLTHVRSAVRPLGCRPYLCQVGRMTAGAPILASTSFPRRVGHVDGPVVRGRKNVTIMSSFAISNLIMETFDYFLAFSDNKEL